MKLVTGRKFTFWFPGYNTGTLAFTDVGYSIVPFDGTQHEFGAFHKTSFELNIAATLLSDSFLPFFWTDLGTAYFGPQVSNYNPQEVTPVLVYRYIGIWRGNQAGTPNALSNNFGQVSFSFSVGDILGATDITIASFGPAQPLVLPPVSVYNGLWAASYYTSNTGLLYPPVQSGSWDGFYGMHVYFNLAIDNYLGGKWRFVMIYHEVQ